MSQLHCVRPNGLHVDAVMRLGHRLILFQGHLKDGVDLLDPFLHRRIRRLNGISDLSRCTQVLQQSVHPLVIM